MKPESYKDWRILYFTEREHLGACCYDHATTRFPWRKPVAFREMQYTIRRIARIRNRMSAEADAFTSSYVECLVEAVTGIRGGSRDNLQ